MHRHSAELDTAKQLHQRLADISVWKPHSKQKGIEILTCNVPEIPYPCMRAEATFEGITAEQWLALGDENFDTGRIVELLDSSTRLVHLKVKGFFPIAARDLTAIVHVDPKSTSQHIQLYVFSVQDPKIPETDSHIRAWLHLGHWTLETVGNSVKLCAMACADPRGHIPGIFVRHAQTRGHAVILRIRDFILNHGSIPGICLEKSYEQVAALADHQYSLEKKEWTGVIQGPGQFLLRVDGKNWEQWDFHVLDGDANTKKQDQRLFIELLSLQVKLKVFAQ